MGYTDDAESRDAFDALFHAELDEVEASSAAFRANVATGRVVQIPGASHYAFLSNRSDVLREVRKFVQTLPQ